MESSRPVYRFRRAAYVNTQYHPQPNHFANDHTYARDDSDFYTHTGNNPNAIAPDKE